MAEGINRRIALEPTPALEARFWTRVAKGKPNECWNWTAAFRNGYGGVKHRGRVFSAHRVAYVLTHGEPDDGLVVAHKCDNRACCNPAHLEAITAKQNNRDARERCDHAETTGEMLPNAVLNEQLVARIWSLHQKKLSGRAIAKELGLNHRTVGSVLCGKSWKHLQPKSL